MLKKYQTLSLWIETILVHFHRTSKDILSFRDSAITQPMERPLQTFFRRVIGLRILQLLMNV